MDMTVTEAQADMRHAYYSGALGIFASSLAWVVATGVALLSSPQHAIWTLLIGGVLIHPIAALLCRMFGASGGHSKANPLGPLAMASTFWLIFSLPLAYGLGLQNPTWFFAAMLLVIGGRYLVFATLFGMRLYWVLGLVLAGAGFILGWRAAPASAVVGAGAAIELVFAAVGVVQHRHWLGPNNSSKPTPLSGSA